MMKSLPNFFVMPPNASHQATSRKTPYVASALVEWSRCKSRMGECVAS